MGRYLYGEEDTLDRLRLYVYMGRRIHYLAGGSVGVYDEKQRTQCWGIAKRPVCIYTPMWDNISSYM